MYHQKIDSGLVIVYESLIKKNPGLLFEQLIEGKTVVGVSRNSRLALLKTVTPEVLRQQTFVLYNDEYVKWFVGDFAAAYGPVDVLFTTNNADAIRSAVREEMAVTIGLDKDMVTLQIDIPKQQAVYLGCVQSEERHLSRVSSRFTVRLKYDLRHHHDLFVP